MVSCKVGALLVPDVAAQPAAFPATRFPFVPKLVENRNPELCKIALEDARTRFMDVGQDNRIITADSKDITWINWEDVPSIVSNNEIIRLLSLDLDGAGKRQTLIYRSFSHSWRGDNHYAYLVRAKAVLDALKANPDELSTILSRIEGPSQSKDQSTGIIPYYPSANLAGTTSKERVTTGSNWEPHRLFRWRNRYFFYDEPNNWGRLNNTQLSLYRLRGDGKVELRCKILLLPDQKFLEDFHKLPGLASFLKVLIAIGSGGGGSCGTLNANFRHDDEAGAAISRAAFRPWAVSRSDGTYYIYNARMMNFIADWGFGDIWNRREVQTFRQHVEPATKALEDYFIRKYGMTPRDAREQAQAVAEELIAAWIMVPNGYLPGKDLYSVSYSPATEALMTRDMHALEEALAQPISTKSYPPPKPLSDLLHDAVEWPAGMEVLLAAGADPNAPGQEWGFEKRPLMTAAHMNRPDSIRLLLKHGADPNLHTVNSKNECAFTIERGNRTALMYAAENAGTGVIKLLLEAGADPTATDSKGNGLGFYLAMNPRFSPEEKRMEIGALVKLKHGSIREPGFDCSKASKPLEKNICGDEVLRLMDGEMSDAYLRWQRVVGTEAKIDQRQWIRSRNEACDSDDPERDIGCLQDQTRARVRYLHNRLEEKPRP